LIILDQSIPWVSDQVTAAYEIDNKFSFLEEQKRSEVLDWQGGYQALYVPRMSYDLDACLATVEVERYQ
jgi:hypothetical protein